MNDKNSLKKKNIFKTKKVKKYVCKIVYRTKEVSKRIEPKRNENAA